MYSLLTLNVTFRVKFKVESNIVKMLSPLHKSVCFSSLLSNKRGEKNMKTELFLTSHDVLL